MVDIFKPRKTPKHLIIQDDYANATGRRLVTIPRLIIVSLVILGLAWALLQYR